MARKQMTKKQRKPRKQNKTRNVRKTKSKTNKNMNKNKNKNKNKSRNMNRRTRSKRGGNKNCNYVPTFFLPKGGMYDVKSNTNGLGKGYYYGHNQCLAPGYPISTVGLTEAQKQKGGSQLRSVKDLARSTMSTIERLYSEITTQPYPINKNPNVMKQPINKPSKPSYKNPVQLRKIVKEANKKVSSM